MKSTGLLVKAAASMMIFSSAAAGVVPSEYRQLECLRFSSGAYIDTGVPVSRVQITMKVRTDAVACGLFGSAWENYKSLYMNQYKAASDEVVWRVGSNQERVDGGSVVAGIHEIVYGKLEVSWGGAYVDGNEISVSTASASTGDCNLLVGKYYTGDTLTGDVYSFAVTNREDGAGVIDLVPVQRSEDGALGFYDRARSVFLENSGNGYLSMPLPSDYEALDYVHFEKGDYVDLGTPVSKVQISMKYRSDLGGYALFGNASGSTKTIFMYQTQADSKWKWCIGGANTDTKGVAASGLHEIVYAKLGVSWGDAYVDGVAAEVSTASSATGESNLLIGKNWTGNPFVGDVYAFSVVNRADGSAVVDLVPCRRKADNRIGFFDCAGNRFFDNASGSPFTHELNPKEYVRLESVHFNGDAYIDTGVPVSRVQITMKVRTDAVACGLFGSAWENYKSLYMNQYKNDSGAVVWRVGSNQGRVDGGSVVAGIHEIVYGKLGVSWGGAYVDGEEISVSTASASTGDYNLLVGKYYSGVALTGDVYSFAVTNRDDCSAVMDLIPCWRVSDRRYGFFDRMRGMFLTHEKLGTVPKPGFAIVIR